MRITLLLILGLFLQTTMFAQTKNQQTEKGSEDIQKELQDQLQDFGSLFGGGEIKIDSLLQNLDLGQLNLGNLDLQNLNLEDLMQLGGGEGGMALPEGLDMEAIMGLMQNMDIEQLLGPLMGDLDKMMPKQPQQEEGDVLKDKDGRPVTKKKKSTKKVYKL